MLQVWKTTGKQPQQLAEQTKQPEELAYLWRWFSELPRQLTWTELHHWQQITHRALRAWEAEVLMQLNRMIPHE